MGTRYIPRNTGYGRVSLPLPATSLLRLQEHLLVQPGQRNLSSPRVPAGVDKIGDEYTREPDVFLYSCTGS